MKRKRLKILRIERDWTQMDVSERTKIPYQRYGRIENGYSDPSPDDRAALARLFQSPVADLFPERAREAAAS